MGLIPRAGFGCCAALLFLAIVAACADGDATSGDGAPVSGDSPGNTVEPVRYATYPATTRLGEGDGAVLVGTLTTRQKCLVVEADDGSVVVPVLPAAESGWDGELERLIVGSHAFGLGDRVSFGGGHLDQAVDVDVPGACAQWSGRFLVSTV